MLKEKSGKTRVVRLLLGVTRLTVVSGTWRKRSVYR